jgi:hypothetical protein
MDKSEFSIPTIRIKVEPVVFGRALEKNASPSFFEGRTEWRM